MTKSNILARNISQITQQHGYILSTDKNVVWSRSQYCIIPKAFMDAAVRLMRWEDFDVNAFDAFCVIIADTEYHGDETQGRKATRGSAEGESNVGFLAPQNEVDVSKRRNREADVETGRDNSFNSKVKYWDKLRSFDYKKLMATVPQATRFCPT